MSIIINQNNYIQPRLRYYSTFEQLLKSNADRGYLDYFNDDKFTFKDVFANKRLFILSEPGYGKTRLLKEIVRRSPEQNKQGLFIDLKKVDIDIDSFIAQNLINADVINNGLSETTFKISSLLKTEDFALKNTDTVVVCIDALDEIKYADFSKFVDRIKNFSSNYNKIHLLISCRIHHFKKDQESFVDTGFNFIEIIRFSSEQTNEYFKSSGLSQIEIKRIRSLFEYSYRFPLIEVPRYLELMIEIIKDKGVEYAKKLTKTEIFEYFISKKLSIEERRTATKKRELIKRVQEKLALLMEIYQVNILSKEELMTFFDDVESNLNISLLQQVPLETFIDRSLLKDNIDTIEFENTEFQEYLAAKEMLRLGRADQSIFDLAVDQEIKEIFPSWFNTLGYAIDLDISLLKPILDFGTSGDSIVQDEEYHRLLTTVDTNRLSVENRKEIFWNVFNYYNKVQHWINHNIARNLSLYFDVSQYTLLKESIEANTATYITKSNVASIIEFLIEMNIFKHPKREYWKNKLVELIKGKNTIVQRHTLPALSRFKDISLIKKAVQYVDFNDEYVAEAFITACVEVGPNDVYSIDCFVRWTKSEREYISARYGLWEIKEKKAIKYLMDCFINDPEFLSQFMEHESIFHGNDDNIIRNIKAVWDNEIRVKLEQIVVMAFPDNRAYKSERSQFIRDAALLLKEKDNNYIFKLIAEIKRSNALRESLFRLRHIFSLLLEKSHVEKFASELIAIGEDRYVLWTFQSINIKKEIYEEGRKYFRKEYLEHERQLKKEPKKQISIAIDLYKDFGLKLERKDRGLFDFYLNNRQQLLPYLTKQDKNRLENKIIELVFDKFDPGDQTLTITKMDGGGRSYTTSNFIHIFGDCLRVAESLKIDVSRYRQRIINYIPFAYYEHLQAIFSLIPDPSEKEIKKLLQIWKKKRDDDLQRFMPETLISASEQYKIIEAVPVLKKFVDESTFLMQDRISALRVIANIQPEEKYFKDVFRKYKNKGCEHQISDDANKYLIEMCSNDDAVNWRFKQIEKRSFPKGAHTVSYEESELRDKHFASPITALKHPKYKRQIFTLLDKSFVMFKKGKDYHSYAQYLWDIVFAYFYNLRETKSYKHLRDLERYIREHSSEEGVNWFKYKLQKLRVEYMQYIGKPQNIAECIKKYNKLKETQYLDIASSDALFELIKKVINEDLRRWVEDEGYYKVVQEAKGKQETLIQKTIKTQFENLLMKKGLRGNEINIRREEQLLDDKRTDFLISYGFIGPILIETKLLHRDEILYDKPRRKYKNTLLNYIKGTKSDFGIFLIFRINDDYLLKDYIPKVKEVYKDCDIEVMELDCIRN